MNALVEVLLEFINLKAGSATAIPIMTPIIICTTVDQTLLDRRGRGANPSRIGVGDED
jgi:hypothetical protein